MTRNKSRNISHNEILRDRLRIYVCTLFVFILGACSSDSETNLRPSQLSQQAHAHLLLDAKRAILNLDVSLVSELSDKLDVNKLLPDQSTLLAWAIETQDPKLVNILLQKGARANIANSNRFTPLIQACRYGNSNIINALLDHGADINSSIEDATSAFQLCAGSTTTQTLQRMVKMGAKYKAQNDYGQTAIMWAANSGNLENLRYLVNVGADINQQTFEGYNALFFAIKSQSLRTIKEAILSGADLLARSQDGTSAAQLAVYTSNYTFLTWFTSELASLMSEEAIQQTISDYDRNGHQLLHAAVKANEVKLVSQLLALGANSKAISKPSKLRWRYEANFKTEDYYPPQQTPIEIAKNLKLNNMFEVLSNSL